MSVAIALAAALGLAVAQNAITVEVGSTLQQMDGFGFSQAFGRASQFEQLSSGSRQQALDYLFNVTTGAGMTIIRNRIGADGTGDSIEPNDPGSPNATATYVWDDYDGGQVWFSQAAMSYGVNTIYADAWTAPGFMKTNNETSNGGYLCGTTGHTCSTGDWRQAYADFLVEYVRLYESVGISITHLGFLNEPDLVTSYDSMQSEASEAASFIPILYDTVASSGLSTLPKIACCDAEGWTDQVAITEGLIANDVEQYLGVITSHSYTSNPNMVMNISLKVWQTENADLNDAWSTTWYSNGAQSEGLTWSSKIATGLYSANLSAYLYWEGAEVNSTTSSFLVLTDGTSVTPSGRLWAFASWSRFVRPGAYRLTTTGTIGSVQTGAVKNTDGSVIVVFTNSGSSSQPAAISFTGFTPSTAVAYLTDNSNTLNATTATLSGGVVTVTMTAYSALTVKLTGSFGNVTTAVFSGTSSSAKSSSSSAIRSVSTTLSASITSAGTSSSTLSTGTCTVAVWGQCGGEGWSGCTVCASGYTCTSQNAWYSQCL